MIFRDGRFVSSYSQIDKYLSCPYSWYLKYIEKIKTDTRSKYLEYGLAIHETLEEYFIHKKNGEILSLEQMLDVYELMFELHDIPFDTEEEKDDYYKHGIVTVERLYTPINELDLLMVGDVEILGVEMPLDLPITVPSFEYNREDYDTVYIIGFIDLVLKTDKGIIVIDHKSGKTLFDKDKLAHNLQFPIYAMAIEKEFGVLPVVSYYNFTKLHKFQQVETDEVKVEIARQEIVKVFKKMQKTKHTAKPSYLCAFCDFGKYQGGQCLRSSDFLPKARKEKLNLKE